ncbi:formate dehydrogenase accessory sulfurtransferase FdhD [Heyndrickxia vini]|uniref:Sulfur carrier protein FdhD n=1 Tax=Heyndrickxia vini TaxID=1476025 RepID=A0ABX7E3F9_9BACI|nr:formate dehydrogenase accessory sulfurtransferase FdhD [Heyndrickxia vini]QQZ09790.1 formate dehydrogenase accessory sulfurtransferase FdhD [Heyndrickxia vini]
MDNKVRKSYLIGKYNGESLSHVQDDIAIEFPLTIHVDGEEFATMVCSPTHLQELVIGFLASEGLIRRHSEIASISIDDSHGFAYVDLVNKKVINKDLYSKRFIGSCCGKSRQFYFHNDVRTAKTITNTTTITIEQSFHLMNLLQHQSADFRLTGGVHNGALCTTNEMIINRTDIGRHNALDKLYGYCLKEKITRSDKIIAFSGRLSSEVILKVAKIGIGIILSKSAPTSLGIDLANDLGITIIGFIRKNQLNIYTHPERVSGTNLD